MKRFILTVTIFIVLLTVACLPDYSMVTAPIVSAIETDFPFAPTIAAIETSVMSASTPSAPADNISEPVSTPAPLLTPNATATSAQPITLRRGVNMGDMLEAPNEGDWGLTVHEGYFDLIKQAGFDFVRLPVRWNAHADQSAPYTITLSFFARIDQVVGWALKRNLVIILDFHGYDDIMSNPWGNEARFLGIWKHIAEHYKNYPPQVLFELLNEPNSQLDAGTWNRFIGETLAEVRVSNPVRDVVIGPVQWNSLGQLNSLDLPNDAHLIATFHYYEPFHFTHQGAEWIGPDSQNWLGTTWDATDAQKADVANSFNQVDEWAKQHNTRVLLGEFGAYSKADMASRIRWTTFVRQQAEADGFSWSYWEFGSGFGIYDPAAGVWRGDLLKALIP